MLQKTKSHKTAPPVLVKADAVAEALSVSQRQVAYWQEQGRIPFVKLGRRCVRYNLPAVLCALGVQTEAAASGAGQ